MKLLKIAINPPTPDLKGMCKLGKCYKFNADFGFLKRSKKMKSVLAESISLSPGLRLKIIPKNLLEHPSKP